MFDDAPSIAETASLVRAAHRLEADTEARHLAEAYSLISRCQPGNPADTRGLALVMAQDERLVELLVPPRPRPRDMRLTALASLTKEEFGELEALDARLRPGYPEERRRAALAALALLRSEFVVARALRILPSVVAKRRHLTPDLEQRLWRQWEQIEARMPDDSLAGRRPDDVLEAIEQQLRRLQQSPSLNARRDAYLRRQWKRRGRKDGSRNKSTEERVARVRELYRSLDHAERKRALAGTSRVLRRLVEAELGVTERTARRIIREALEQELGAITIKLARQRTRTI